MFIIFKRFFMSVEAKLTQILSNQATIIGNQATILTAIQSGDETAIAAALTQIEGQVTAIQATIGTDTDGATATPAPHA